MPVERAPEYDVKPAQPSADRPGLLTQAGGAAAQGAARTAGLLDSVANLPGAVFDRVFDPGQTSPPSGRFAPTFGPGVARAGQALFGETPEPETGAERLVQSSARGAGAAAPTMLLPGGGMGLGARAVWDLLSGATGELATDTAAAGGAGPVGQFAAGLLGGLTPNVARGAGSRAMRFARSEQIRDTNLVALEEATDRLFRTSDPVDAQVAFRQRAEEAAAKLEEAFSGVGNVEGIPTARIKAAAQSIRDETLGEVKAAGALFPWLRNIEKKVGNETDLKTLRRLRSQLSRTIREDLRGQNQKIKWASDLIGEIDGTLDDVAQRSGTQEIESLRRALELAKDNAKQFGGGSVAARLFEDFATEGLNEGFRRRVLNAPKPVEAFEQLRRSVGDNPQAQAGLNRLVRDEVLGNELQAFGTPAGLSAAMRRLGKRRTGALWEAAFGPGSRENAQRFLRTMRDLSRRGQLPTDTSIPNTGIISSVMSANLSEAAFKAIRAVSGAAIPRPVDVRRLVTAAMNDPKLGRGFLEPLKRGDYDVWTRNLRNFLLTTTRSAQSSGLLGQQ